MSKRMHKVKIVDDDDEEKKCFEAAAAVAAAACKRNEGRAAFRSVRGMGHTMCVCAMCEGFLLLFSFVYCATLTIADEAMLDDATVA